MNYIKRLQHDIDVYKRAIRVYDDEVQVLVKYLCSDKFHEDPTVQVQDVLNRIGDTRRAVVDALDELSERKVES